MPDPTIHLKKLGYKCIFFVLLMHKTKNSAKLAKYKKWVPFPFNSVSIIKLISKYELKLVFERDEFVLFTFTQGEE